MGKIKDRKWPYIVLSILAATALWLYVRGQENTDANKKLDRIDLEFYGTEVLESRGLMMASSSAQTVDIRVKGQWATMNRITRESDTAVVDLSRITEAGEYELSYEVELPSGFTTQEREPDTITVVIADYAEKDIPVQAVFDGSVADGFQTGKILVSPDTLHISGSAEVVGQVQYAEVTVTGDHLSQSVSGDYPYRLMGAGNTPIDGTGLNCSTDTLFVTMPVVTVKDVPLTVELISSSGISASSGHVICTIEPAVISVSGEPEDLDALNEITLGTINLDKVINSGAFSFNIVLPGSLNNVSEVTTATVNISFQGLVTKSITATDIKLVNLPEGFQATAVTQSKDILVRGTEGSVDQVTASHIRIEADLSEAPSATGRYTVNGKVVLEGISDVDVVGDYSIVVNLTR